MSAPQFSIAHQRAEARVQAEVTEALDSLMRDWPGVAPRDVEYGHLDPDTYGATTTGWCENDDDKPDPDRIVTISAGYANDYSKWRTTMWGSCHSPDGSFARGINLEAHPAKYTMEHEFGHVLLMSVYGYGYGDDEDTVPDSEAARRRLVAIAFEAVGAPRALPSSVPAIWNMGLLAPMIEDDLSGYATASPEELLAEAFAVDRNAPGHSKIATAVMKQIRADYLKKYASGVA